MMKRYRCTDSLCREKHKRVHEIDLPDELVMDERNMAILYCPKCKHKLTRIK